MNIDTDALRAKYAEMDYVHTAKWGEQPVDAETDIENLLDEVDRLRAELAAAQQEIAKLREESQVQQWRDEYSNEEVQKIIADLATARSHVKQLVIGVRPSWFYTMGKEGYECSWCHVMLRHGMTKDAEAHNDGCEYVAAAWWLAEHDKV